MNDQLEQLRDKTKAWPRDALIRQNLQFLLPDFFQQQSEYWTAMSGLSAVFASKGVQFKTIKSIRSYPYVDSNIDIIVEKRQWRSLSNAVAKRAWRKPRFQEFLEQTFVEPYKLKYRAIVGNLAAAHFYAGVRWRYVEPFRLDGIEPDHLWRRLPDEYRDLVGSSDDHNILVPTEEFDIVIQAAHVTIENYRLTIGELIHIGDTIAKPGFDRVRMNAIACELGLSACVGAICDIASRYSDGGPHESFPQKPLYIPFKVIFRSHMQYGLNTGLLGLARAMASLAWYPVMRLGRKILGR